MFGSFNVVPSRVDEFHWQTFKFLVILADNRKIRDFPHFSLTPDLDCDYLATSLHKWTCAPFGTGLLYVRKGKIASIWPLVSSPQPEEANIRKFENLGTRNMAAEYAIGDAVDFHLKVGSKRKEDRLRFLKNYWIGKMHDVRGFKLLTPGGAAASCAIASFSIEGIAAADIANTLQTQGVHTTVVQVESMQGVRISPHIYTSITDLDFLVERLKKMAA
jgi:selenocysteine lyase/cysteine desulfurase